MMSCMVGLQMRFPIQKLPASLHQSDGPSSLLFCLLMVPPSLIIEHKYPLSELSNHCFLADSLILESGTTKIEKGSYHRLEWLRDTSEIKGH